MSGFPLQAEVHGDFESAYENFNKALTIEREELGEEDVQTAITLNNMAMVKRRTGDYDKAMDLCVDSFLLAFLRSL